MDCGHRANCRELGAENESLLLMLFACRLNVQPPPQGSLQDCATKNRRQFALKRESSSDSMVFRFCEEKRRPGKGIQARSAQRETGFIILSYRAGVMLLAAQQAAAGQVS